MPYKEREIQKMFYTIGEVAQMFNVNTSHIRFWSKQFDVIKPATNKKGNRLFTVSDIANFKVIYHLVKEKGFTLKGAKVEMQAMRKKMKIEHKPETSKSEVNSNEQATEIPFEENTKLTSSHSDDIVDKMALVNSLERIKTSLVQLQSEIGKLEQ